MSRGFLWNGHAPQRRDWLGWEDSNTQMLLSKMPFEMWGEFPLISERSATRDLSRKRCCKSDIHLRAEVRAGLIGLEPVSCSNLAHCSAESAPPLQPAEPTCPSLTRTSRSRAKGPNHSRDLQQAVAHGLPVHRNSTL